MCAYNADEILVAHLLDWNVVHQARYDGSRTGLLAKVNLLQFRERKVYEGVQ